ncbi:MAG: glucosaminidase domain-containing protein [Bacteroidota bacterium]
MKITAQLFFSLLFFFFTNNASAQNSTYDEMVNAYVNQFKDIAVKKMKDYKIPASITLAQGIIESGCGKSDLATEANNHFGIKCHKDWTGETFYKDDDTKNECFRKYKNAEESYNDHSLFLSTRDRYAFLFDLEVTNYKAWATGLKQAGYATNPKYAETLINLIEKYKLNAYDDGSVAQNQTKPAAKKDAKKDTKPKVIKKTKPISTQVDMDDFESISIGFNNRRVYENNGVKFFIARENDSFSKIAADAEISVKTLKSYNDFDENDSLKPGEMIYIEAKKRNSNSEYYVVKQGDNLHSISQYFGIKLNRLCKINNIEKGTELKAGKKLLLKKKSFLGLFG